MWKDEDFIKAVSESKTNREVILKMGSQIAQGHYNRRFHEYRKRLSVDTSHFDQYHGNKNRAAFRRLPDTEIFCIDSKVSRDTARKRMLEQGHGTTCEICGLVEWCGKPISFHLDHINGINNDNRIENLRLICPNCHSQTETYAGKNTAMRKKSSIDLFLQQI